MAVALSAGAAYRYRTHLPWIGHRFVPPKVDEYVCPMHPEVRQATPGTCPLCGMDLVKESTLSPAAADTHTDPAQLRRFSGTATGSDHLKTVGNVLLREFKAEATVSADDEYCFCHDFFGVGVGLSGAVAPFPPFSYIISIATATASPPPIQSDATPFLPPVLLSAPMSVTMMRAPDAPIG